MDFRDKKLALELAQQIWAYFRKQGARVIKDRRGRPNFLVALALARHIVSLSKYGYDPETFDIQYLDPDLTHRENIENLHSQNILPTPPPEEKDYTKRDEALWIKAMYENILESGMLPHFGSLVGETREADEYRKALEILKKEWEKGKRVSMKQLLYLLNRRKKEIDKYMRAGRHWGPVIPDTKTSREFWEVYRRLRKYRKRAGKKIEIR